MICSTRNIHVRNEDQPSWFNKQKMIDKQHNTHRKYKKTGDPYYMKKYKQHRRNNKKELKKLKKN